jgi:hypothetical protein
MCDCKFVTKGDQRVCILPLQKVQEESACVSCEDFLEREHAMGFTGFGTVQAYQAGMQHLGLSRNIFNSAVFVPIDYPFDHPARPWASEGFIYFPAGSLFYANVIYYISLSQRHVLHVCTLSHHAVSPPFLSLPLSLPLPVTGTCRNVPVC